MKTEVRKEHGDWIVFVDDNPQFSFMYREEAEKVRNMVDALMDVHEYLKNLNNENGYKPSPMRDKINLLEKTLLKAGCKL